MDIVIKSYNRAYLLDRVLYSIRQYVVNGLGQIIILDDGTPPVFLDKIKEKYPEVVIKYSPNYAAKLEGKAAEPPVQFWREEIQKVSQNFLLLEDDMWLVQDIDLNQVDILMREKHIAFMKLRWGVSKKAISADIEPLDGKFGLIENLKLPFASGLLVRNRFFLHSLMLMLNIMPKNYFIPLYILYDVAGQLFSRDYYLYVWPERQNSIEEMIQLGRAVQYFKKNKEYKVGWAISNEYTATSFLSSSSGNREKLGFDMNELNRCLNQAWLQGDLNILQNFPADFSLEYLSVFLEDDNAIDSEFIANWKKWSKVFRLHFINMGSDLSVYNNTNELK